MRRKTSALRLGSLTVLTALLLVAGFDVPARGGDPRGAFYSPDTDKVFWFIHFADIHIGARGTQDSANLTWLVTTGKSVVAPAFMVAAGDLTDSTNGSWLGWPNGPYQAEWDEYKSILNNRVTASDYYDLPGNHDAYNDRYFAYYLANSVQGRATNRTQHSWTHSLGTRTYHFLGVNSSANNGAAFSLSFPYGDYAGLDETELGYISQALYDNRAADLTLVFGHHPVTDTGVSGDTWLFYGHREFIGALDGYAGSLYGYGHTHRYSDVLFKGNSYTGTMTNDGVRYLNISSLGKASSSHYSVIAIDCNGVSAVAANVNQWPVVLITAPVAKGPNPYAYTVPANAGNPIRALVFDANNVTSVRCRVDGGGTWYTMSPVVGNPRLWAGTWDAAGLAAGDHTITVEAVGTATRSHTITVTVASGGTANEPPVAYGQPVEVLKNVAKAITLTASDPNGDTLTYAVVSGPSNGALTGTPPNLTYTPGTGYAGPDSFTFQANDGELDSNVATVSINVVNSAPLAGDDSYTTDQDKTLTVGFPGVLANDSDPDNDPLTAVLSDGPSHGSVTLNADGSFIYTPAGGYSGLDSFSYNATDGQADSNIATVSIAVKQTSTTPDVITILLADYTSKTRTLKVEATSSRQPEAVLTVDGYGTMTYNSRTKKYTFSKKVQPAPTSVTVTSSLGGSATKEVSPK